jgi:hypothetical protein
MFPASTSLLPAFQMTAFPPLADAGGEVLMKRLILPLVVAAAVGAAVASAQSKDLSGSWTLDVERSGTKNGPSMLVITLTDKELTARGGDPKAPPMTFTLDGSETTMKDGAKTKASWNGNKLDATVISPHGVAETVSFSRDGEWLLMQGVSKKDGPMKLYFKKTPAKL